MSAEYKNIYNYLSLAFSSKKEVKNLKPCIISFQGQTITTYSGKCVWKNKGDAKKALICHLHRVDPQILAQTGAKNTKEFVSFLEAAGIVEFVEIGK